MHEHSIPHAPLPWYRQGWPWFLIALPASAVVSGFAILYLAIHSPHALVVDDYYKEGLAINRQIGRQTTAHTLGLTAALRSDGKQLSLDLSATKPVSDESVNLKFIHVVRAELDREVIMHRHADGRYYAALPPLPNGIWNLHLGSMDHRWEIDTQLRINGPFQVSLTH